MYKRRIMRGLEQITQDQSVDVISHDIADDYKDEEIGFLQDESRVLTTDIIEEAEVNERLIDTVSALESLLESVKKMPDELSQENYQHIHTTMQMAVAGMSMSCEQFMPGLEAYKTREAAMEGIIDTIKNTMENIFASEKKMLGIWSMLFRNALSQARIMREKIAKTRQKNKSYNSDSQASFKVYFGKRNVGEFGMITDVQSFLKTYNHDTDMLSDLADNIMDMGSTMLDLHNDAWISMRSKDTYNETLEAHYNTIKKDFFENIIKSRYFRSDTRNPDYTKYRSENFQGKIYIDVHVPARDSIQGLSDSAISKVINHMKVAFVDDYDKHSDKGERLVEFHNLSNRDWNKILDQADSTAKLIQTFLKSEVVKTFNHMDNQRSNANAFDDALSGGWLTIIATSFMKLLKMQNKLMIMYSTLLQTFFQIMYQHVNNGWNVASRATKIYRD